MVLGQQMSSTVSYHTEKHLYYTSEINLHLEFQIVGSGIRENSLDWLDGWAHKGVKDRAKNYSGTFLMICISSKLSPSAGEEHDKKLWL